jgi:CHAT domain-containing protein
MQNCPGRSSAWAILHLFARDASISERIRLADVTFEIMRKTQEASAARLCAAALFLLWAAAGWTSGCGHEDDPRQAHDRIVHTIDHGDLNASLVDVERALRRSIGSTPEWHWRFLILKARILVSRSQFKDALKLLQDELPASLVGSDVAVRKKLMEGIAHRYGQEFEKSERELNEALLLARSTQPQLVCEVVKAIGELQVDEQKYAEADASFHQALELARKEKRTDQVASVLVDLGRLSTKEEHYDEAIDRNQIALDLSRSLDMQGLVATVLGNTAWSYSQLGDFEKALASYKEAADASEQIGQTGYSFYWLTGVANSYIALHDLRSARTLLQDTLARARTLSDTETITICLNALAEISLKENRLDEAANYELEALKYEEEGLDHFGTIQSKILSGRIETGRMHLPQAEKLLQSVLDDPNADTPSRWEAQARLAKVHDVQGLPKRAEQEYRESIKTIEAARAAITQPELRMSFLSGGIEFYDDYVEFLIAHERPRDALKIAELSRAQTLEEGLGSWQKATQFSEEGIQPQQQAERLGATLLFYWMGLKHSYLWAVTPATTAYFALPPASEVDPKVKAYREAVAGSQDVVETNGNAAEKLYETLVAPAQKFIAPNSRVVLLPDGSLYSLNFETLIVPGPKPHFWIEDVTLTTASSLSLLASSANRSAVKQKNLLLVGDALKASEDFEQLPQAEDEMKIVEGYFPESKRTVLKREQATPAAYLASNPERYAYLHFVTHGTASRAQPLESAVILSKEPASDAYKLYARDIVTRHLNAELVTISACNGSGTRAYSGEGLVGLSWAFVRAGAHNVIAALWEVSNAPSTSQLMDAFYKGLGHGEDTATALRNAKLLFLHSSDSNSAFKKPYYWAPFQLYAGS